jgi:hypothetical protein
MKLNKSLSRPNWRNALFKIAQVTGQNLEPVIVVRRNTPILAFRIQQFFIFSMGATFTRLGVTCTLVDAISELADITRERRPHSLEALVQLIVSSKTKLTGSHFIIDNCHCMSPDQIFLVLGLMMELERQVQFWFLFPKGHFQRWRSKHSGDERVRYFLKMIKSKYEI